jgi:hypothetical protein
MIDPASWTCRMKFGDHVRIVAPTAKSFLNPAVLFFLPENLLAVADKLR